MTNPIWSIMTKIRRQLIEYDQQQHFLTDNLPLTENFDIREYLPAEQNELLQNCNIYGFTMIHVDRWQSLKKGVKIADVSQTRVEYISLRLHDEKLQPLPLVAIIHTFLHELAHAITIPEQHYSRHLSRRLQKLQPMIDNSGKSHKFVPCHHSNSFYRNFAKILRIAEKLQIYQLPSTHRNFTIKNIQRYDSMINPSDKISLGTTSIII